MADNLKAILEHINGEVAKLSTTSTHALGSVLDAAEKELTQDLATWHMLGKGDERFTPQLYRNALIQIRSALNTINKDLGDDVADHLKHQGKIAAGLATKHLRQEVEQFSHLFEGAVRPVALEAATVLAVGEKAVWKRFETSAARYAGQVGKDIQKQLAIGVVKGETVDQLTKRLAKMGGPKGWVNVQGMGANAKAEFIAEGLFSKYRHYAERLVRTEVVNAYNSFALDGMEELNKEDPGYMKRWDAAIDGRTCVLCASYDDLVRKLDEPFKDGIQQPPAHSNCRCAQVVWRKEWTEAEHRHDAGRTDKTVREALEGKAGGQMPAPAGITMPHKVIYKDLVTQKAVEKITKEIKTKVPKTPKIPKVVPTTPTPNNTLTAIQEYTEAAKEAYQVKQKAFFESLSVDERASIRDYQSPGYERINTHLRKPSKKDTEYKKENLRNIIKHIDNAISKSKLDKDTLVYRGTRKDIVSKLKVGDIFQDKGYMSVTEDPRVMKQFAGGSEGNLFHIEIPEGTEGAHISYHGSEAEILLPKGTKIQILSIEDETRMYPKEATHAKAGQSYTTGRKIVRARVVK